MSDLICALAVFVQAIVKNFYLGCLFLRVLSRTLGQVAWLILQTNSTHACRSNLCLCLMLHAGGVKLPPGICVAGLYPIHRDNTACMLQRSEVVSTYPTHAAHAPQSMPFAHKRLILPRFGDFWLLPCGRVKSFGWGKGLFARNLLSIYLHIFRFAIVVCLHIS